MISPLATMLTTSQLVSLGCLTVRMVEHYFPNSFIEIKREWKYLDSNRVRGAMAMDVSVDGLSQENK